MKIGERGQITIPKELRDKYGLQKDVDVDFIEEDAGIRIVKRSQGTEKVSEIRGITKLKHAKSVDEYIEDIRGK